MDSTQYIDIFAREYVQNKVGSSQSLLSQITLKPIYLVKKLIGHEEMRGQTTLKGRSLGFAYA